MAQGSEAVSSKGVVAAEPQEAADIGARMLAAGGNAMDAASAAAMAGCMMRPHATGLAGYVCSAVVLEGATGRVWSLDANAIAPAAAREDMYDVLPPAEGGSLNEREYACRVKDDENLYGPRAIAAPGMMAGIGMMWERWGRLKWDQIVAASQELIEKGFPYGPLASAIAAHETLIRRFEHTALHLLPDGRLPKADDLCHRPDMERTLARLAKAGWRDFYDGELGREIGDYVELMGGALTREDMAAYQPRVTPPHETTFRGAAVYGALAPNGSLTALQILNMLEAFEPLPDSDPAYWHRLIEVLKLAWRDRLSRLADPACTDSPVELLLSKKYALGRVEALRQQPDRVDLDQPAFLTDLGHGTLHVSAADAGGNVASMTISQGGAFGSFVTIPRTGLIVGHGMCRFDPRPGRLNSVAPGKRPLNNTAPLVLRLEDRDVAVGLPGGRRILAAAARMAQLLIESDIAGREAACAPRLHVEAAEPIVAQDALPEPILTALRGMGHEIKTTPGVAGNAHIAEYLKSDGRLRAGSGPSGASAGADA